MGDDEAVREFLVETREGLDQLDREFVALEADPAAKDRIATVFRTIHTIKGTSAFLGYTRLEKLTHVGTTFSFTLRLAPEAPRPEEPVSNQGVRVLVVDDEPNALSALASLLEDEGFIVETAVDGLAALPEVREFAPDILVVDVEMPGLKGDGLVRKVREDHAQLPVILMTGHGDQVVATARIELDAAYIGKPFGIDELVAAIHDALSTV